MSSPLENAALAPFHQSVITTTPIAGLIVRPTTVALGTLWNGANEGGNVLVIDRAYCYQEVSGAAQGFFGLWYCMHLEMTKPTNDIITLRGTGDGSEPDLSKTVYDVGATVLNDGWFPIGPAGEVEEVGTTIPGAQTEWECNGRLIVLPRHGISFHVVAATVNEDFTVGCSFWNVPRKFIPVLG